MPHTYRTLSNYNWLESKRTLALTERMFELGSLESCVQALELVANYHPDEQYNGESVLARSQ
jgi:hypothetical protein